MSKYTAEQALAIKPNRLRGMRFRGEAVMLKPLPPSKSPRYRLK